jgi:hypothetical protein
LGKGTNIDPFEILLKTKPSKVYKIKGSKNRTQDTRMPYGHPNYKKKCII